MSEYQLRTDVVGRKRLNLQGELYNPGSQYFLLAQGIDKGQSVLEVGCGSASMTPWLAEQVGKTGRVLAIDNSFPQVLATQKIIKKLGLKQVECREFSVFELERLKEKFDIIYLRCVLIHLTEPDAALKQIYRGLKKGGKVVIDEITNSCNFCYPENPAFLKRRHVIEQFFKRNGLNPNFGLSLKSRLKKLKFSNIHEFMYQPILNNPKQKKLLTLFLHESKNKFISLGILTEKEWTKLVKELEKLETEKNSFISLSSLYQISAERM